MGCSSAREKIEVQMLMLQMRKKEIHKERQDKLTKLIKVTGEPVKRKPVKDYLIIPIQGEHKHIIKLTKIKEITPSHKNTEINNDDNKATRNKRITKIDDKSTYEATDRIKHGSIIQTCGEEVEEEEDEEEEVKESEVKDEEIIEEKESEENEDNDDDVEEKKYCSVSEDNNDDNNIEDHSSEIKDDHLCYYYNNKKYYFEEINN